MRRKVWLPLLGASLAFASGCKRSRDTAPRTEEHVAPALPDPGVQQNEVDLYGDPLPEHAVARLGSLRMFDREIEAMVFSAAGDELVTNTAAGYAVWTVTRGTVDRVLAADHPTGVFALSPSGRLARVRGDQGALEILDLADGAVTLTLQGHKKPASALCFAGEDRLISGGVDGSLRLWDTASSTSKVFEGNFTEVSAVACHPSGTVAFGTSEGAVYAVKNAAELVALGRGVGGIHSLAISADGKRIAAGSGDGSLLLWTSVVPKAPVTIKAHKRVVLSLHFGPRGRLYSSGGDDWFRVWDGTTGAPIDEIPGIDGLDAQLIALSPDAALMASWSSHAGERGSEAGRWWLWNIADGTLLLEPERHRRPVNGIAYSIDGARIVTAGADRRVRVWQAASGKAIDVLDSPEGPVNDVMFAKDGARVFFAGNDAQLSAWDLKSGDEKPLFQAVGGAVNAFDIDLDKNLAVTGDQIGRVWTWDLSRGARVQAHDRGGYSAIFDVDLAPGGSQLAIAGAGPQIRVVDLSSGSDLAELSPPGATSNFAVGFSPDGTLLASGGDDHKIHLWSAGDWKLLRSLSGHDGTVRCLAFSKDGKLLVSGGNDEMVRVWDPAEGSERAVFAGHKDVVTDVAVAPDGRHAASASRDRSALVWKLP